MNAQRALTLKQKNELCMVTRLGCDPTTARNYFGISAAQLREELRRDPDFAQQLDQAAASAELHHMRNVHQAAKDEKNWRTSVWWLERRVPEQFARRDPRAIAPEEWTDVLRQIAEAVLEVIDDVVIQARLIARLQQIVGAAPQRDRVEQAPAIGEGDDDDLA